MFTEYPERQLHLHGWNNENDIITPIDDMSHEKCFLSVCVSHNRTSLYKYRNYERGRQFRKLWCLTPL